MRRDCSQEARRGRRNGLVMPWTPLPDGPLPIVEWAGTDPVPDVPLTEAIAAFLDHPGRRAQMEEIDGCLCARLVAISFDPDDAVPSLERIDLVLRPSHLLMRRRPISGTCAALTRGRLEVQWSRTPPDRRDTSVLFLQIIDAVVDASAEVLDEIHSRVGLLEERLLIPNPPLNRVLSSLLELSHHLSNVRDGLLPLRGDIRELAELAEPVERGLLSDAGMRWLRNVELDLIHDVPAGLATVERRITGALAQLHGERSEATNRFVLLLTIITVSFFVPTLMTGLYGMNVPLPGQESRGVFWAFIAVGVAFLGVAGVLITRLGLWGTFVSILPGLRRDAPPPRAPSRPR